MDRTPNPAVSTRSLLGIHQCRSAISSTVFEVNNKREEKEGTATVLQIMRPEIYKEEGYKLMGAAFEVYNEQGYGLAEEIYQESLEFELESRGMQLRSKHELQCFYKGRPLKKKYVPDLFVLGCLIVELKAVTALLPEHEAQLINYMRITRQPVGYLINFGHKDTLEWKRIILSEYIPAA